jgi:hypothetical protein
LMVDFGPTKSGVGRWGKRVVEPVAMSTHLQEGTSRYQVDIRKAL